MPVRDLACFIKDLFHLAKFANTIFLFFILFWVSAQVNLRFGYDCVFFSLTKKDRHFLIFTIDMLQPGIELYASFAYCSTIVSCSKKHFGSILPVGCLVAFKGWGWKSVPIRWKQAKTTPTTLAIHCRPQLFLLSKDESRASFVCSLIYKSVQYVVESPKSSLELNRHPRNAN